MDMLTGRGRAIRLVVTLLAVTLTLAGSLWGGDDHFPFGPQLQFANADKLNDPVVVLRVEAIDATGARFELNERNAGLRRAEIEAQVERFKADPALLRTVGEAFAARQPEAPPLAEIDLLERRHELLDGRATGRYTDVTLAVWRR
jgi:hypothetical protein